MKRNKQIDVRRALALASIFNFLCSCSKGCLLPFLTLYLRQLGLTPVMTGVVMGAKHLISLVWSPVASLLSNTTTRGGVPEQRSAASAPVSREILSVSLDSSSSSPLLLLLSVFSLRLWCMDTFLFLFSSSSRISFDCSFCAEKLKKREALRKNMEKERKCSQQYGSLEKTQVDGSMVEPAEDVVSMADSTITVQDIEGELVRIERIRDILVRRESELRYMMDDIQLCKEITRLKTELQKLVSVPDKDKSKEDREREEELLLQINKLVETRDFLVDDVEFERLREREEDREMAAFLQSKFPKALAAKGSLPDQTVASKSQQTSSPFITKTGLTLLKDCCGFTCSVM